MVLYETVTKTRLSSFGQGRVSKSHRHSEKAGMGSMLVFFDEGIQKLVLHYKYLNLSDYMETCCIVSNL